MTDVLQRTTDAMLDDPQRTRTQELRFSRTRHITSWAKEDLFEFIVVGSVGFPNALSIFSFHSALERPQAVSFFYLCKHVKISDSGEYVSAAISLYKKKSLSRDASE